MKIYIRKLFAHDITHQISITREIVSDFFENGNNNQNFKFRGKNSGFEGDVSILFATDPRFGGDIKNIIEKEGGASVNDLLLIYKFDAYFLLEIVRPSDVRYNHFFELYNNKERHVICNFDDSSFTNQALVDEEYRKFKKLLSWFVGQSRINNGLIEGKKVQGQGYLFDSSIRNFYKEWREYDGFTLDCNLQAGKKEGGPTNFSTSKRNYINYYGFDIRPKYNEEGDIVYFYLDVNKKDVEDVLDKEFSPNKYIVVDLDLFSNNEPNELIKKLFGDFKKLIDLHLDFQKSVEPLKGGENLLIYGTPGCGKSYFVANTLLHEIVEDNVFRCTFYQDYANSDFVGQILPEVEPDGSVTYKFIPGPFALALRKALEKPGQKVAIVIEELNRGNAPSIFGDVFQLLDRVDGVSRYDIQNINLTRYLDDELGFDDAHKKIKIPSNLFIYATMNTSDQNVFTLDTAFKRRWKFKKLENKFDDYMDEDGYKFSHDYKDYLVPGSGNMTWQELVEKINKYMLNHGEGINAEDKQLGVFFVEKEVLVDPNNNDESDKKKKEFAYKVLEYLWDDVAKFNKPAWFNDKIHSIDELIDGYMNEGLNVFNDDVFKKDN